MTIRDALPGDRESVQQLLRDLRLPVEGVAPDFQGCGFGLLLYEAILARARAMEVREIILLTETAARFFERLGFEVTDRMEAGVAIGASVEFRSACPASAVCMRLRLR